jgi:Xaa-Pro aminopeptidase
MKRRAFLQASSLLAAATAAPQLALAAENKIAAVPTKDYPPLTGPFRLPQEWYRGTTARFQKQLTERGLDGAVVTDSHNIEYLTGAFAVTTERPLWLFVPAKGAPSVFYPGLDRDLWTAWWVTDGEWYFDYHHFGPYDQVVWKAGAQADLFEWMLRGLTKRNFHKSRVSFDRRPGDDQLATLKRVTPNMKADWKAAREVLLRMRQVKTAEELALCRQAITLQDRMTEFAHDYILTHGTDITDFEVGHATEQWGTHELMKYLQLDGRPHTGVGLRLNYRCRTGVATAYPHPNQFYYAKIKRGDAIQISANLRIGGYGGEGYRALQSDGPGVGKMHHYLWDTHTAMTLEQQKLMKAGTPCNVVAEGVLKLARDAGLEKYVYHRPAHGEGAEGHQAPYLALGDNTVLQENMCFSNEPGLYDPQNGFGYNHSNFVRVTATGGEQFNQVPLTKEFCWIKF